MDRTPEAGRRLVLAIIMATLALSVLTIVTFYMIQGPARLPQQIVRFGLTVGLCIFLYQGANWARWVASILFALAGGGALLVWVLTLSISMAGLVLLVMGVVYVSSAITLLFVPSVRAHFGVA